MDCHTEVRQGWEEDAKARRQADEEATWCRHAGVRLPVVGVRSALPSNTAVLCMKDDKYALPVDCKKCRR